MQIQPAITIYFDPKAIFMGKRGCFRAKLRDSAGCHAVGETPEAAVYSLLLTITSFADLPEFATLPRSIESYTIQRIDHMNFREMKGSWNRRDEAAERRAVEEAIQTESLVAGMLWRRSK